MFITNNLMLGYLKLLLLLVELALEESGVHPFYDAVFHLSQGAACMSAMSMQEVITRSLI